MASQSRAAKYVQNALGHLACRVFQSSCLVGCSSSNRASAASRSASSNSSQRLMQVAFDRQNGDHPPLGVEALLRGPMRRVGDDRSEVAQPMHRLDVRC